MTVSSPQVDITSVPDTHTLNWSSGNSESQGRELMGQAVVSIPHCSSESNAVLSSPLVLAICILVLIITLSPRRKPSWSLDFLWSLFMRKHHHSYSWILSTTSPPRVPHHAPDSRGLSLADKAFDCLTAPLLLALLAQAPSMALPCLMEPGHRVLTILMHSLLGFSSHFQPSLWGFPNSDNDSFISQSPN